MTHDHQPTSLENQFNTPEAQEAYRDDLANRVVTESMGAVCLWTSLDLSAEEKMSMSSALQSRQEMAGNEKPPVGLNAIKSNGGWAHYGDVGFAPGLERETIQLLKEGGSQYGEDEQIVFAESEDGRTTINYRYNAYTDGTRRPGSINLSFSLPVEMASEIRTGIASDPSIIDQIAKGQIEALGLGGRTELATMNPGGMDVELGPIKGYNPVGDDRKKIIYSRDAAGRAIREESVRYGDKVPLAIPESAQERLGLAVEAGAISPQEEISIEQNILDNEVREEARRLDRAGYAHWEKALNFREHRLSTVDPAKADSYETVYSELMDEPVTAKELNGGWFADKNSDHELSGEDMESYLYEEIAEAVRLMCLDKDNRHAAYEIVNAEADRYASALNDDELYEAHKDTLQAILQALDTLSDALSSELENPATPSKFYQQEQVPTTSVESATANLEVPEEATVKGREQAVDAARGDIEAVFANQPRSVFVGGQEQTVTDSYRDAKGNEWITYKDAQGQDVQTMRFQEKLEAPADIPRVAVPESVKQAAQTGESTEAADDTVAFVEQVIARHEAQAEQQSQEQAETNNETKETVDDAEKNISMLQRGIDNVLRQGAQMEADKDRFRSRALDQITQVTTGLKRLYAAGNQRLDPSVARRIEDDLGQAVHYARQVLQVENSHESALSKPMMNLRRASKDEKFDEGQRDRFDGHARAIDTYVRRQSGVAKAGQLLKQLNMVTGNVRGADTASLISQLTRITTELTQKQAEKRRRGDQPDELTVLLKDIQKDLAEL